MNIVHSAGSIGNNKRVFLGPLIFCKILVDFDAYYYIINVNSYVGRVYMQPRICLICNKEFQPHNPRQKICDDDHYHPCPNCGKPVLANKLNEQNKCCSRKCGQVIGNASRKKTLNDKYGVDNPIQLNKIFTKICKYCGKEFQTTSPRQIYCGDDYYNCPICGKPVKIKDMKNIGAACSMKCRQVKIASTNLEKYGSEVSVNSLHGKAKARETCQKKYGVDHYSKTEEFKEKFKSTSRKRYGTDAPLQNPEIKAKQIATNIERYGDNSPTCSQVVKDKVKDTFVERYGGFTFQSEILSKKVKATNKKLYNVENPMQNEEIHQKAIDTTFELYGVEFPLQNKDIRDKSKFTSLDRYGVEFPSQSREVKNKVKSAFQERYGVDNVFQSEEIKEKIKETWIKNYGVDNPMKSDRIKEKAQAKNIERYGAPSYMQSIFGKKSSMLDSSNAEEYIEFLEHPKEFIALNYSSKPTVTMLSQRFKISASAIYFYLDSHNLKDLVQYHASTMEEQIKEFLNSLDIEYIVNDRTEIAPNELDFYIPKYNLAIECNPTATHNSSCLDPWGSLPKSPSYHKIKSENAQEKGIFLFHIFGYEWTNKKEIIFSMLTNLLGKNKYVFYGRDTYIQEVPYDQCAKFLNNNHRQGNVTNGIRIGLYTKSTNELVSVMIFSQNRFTIGKKQDEWELSRFCNKLNTNVVGGASKLFKYFIKNYRPNQIVSYSDIAHTKGTLYKILKFKQISISYPNYVWVKLSDDSYFTRVTCQKKNLRKLFNDETIDIDNKTEREIMIEHGYVQVFDSGVIRWEWTKDS